jgi:hypothetical protein
LSEEEKRPVSLYFPKALVEEIDDKRGRLSRSLFLTLLLERVLPGEKSKVA